MLLAMMAPLVDVICNSGIDAFTPELQMLPVITRFRIHIGSGSTVVLNDGFCTITWAPLLSSKLLSSLFEITTLAYDEYVRFSGVPSINAMDDTSCSSNEFP